MATSMETKSLTSTDHSITSDEGPASFFCRQCQAAYRQPKILKCLHSFCSQCLENVLDKATERHAMTCPLCACVTIVPPGGVKDLTSNSFLSRISNDYVNEVKSNLASKSLYGRQEEYHQTDMTNPLAKASDIRSSFRHELQQHVHTNLTDEQKSESTRAQINQTTKTGEESNATALEAAKNRNRLQAKSMGLQGEALRVTYAIDHVNHHKTEWLQRREDLKRAIQRRSAQFQSLVKRMERQLISQIEDKSAEDRFYESLDRGKTELRKNLKQVLHEVSVIKSVREMGNGNEVNELSSSLLCPSVGVVEVILENIKYQLDLPTKSIDEMVRVGFGNLVTTTEEKSVYVPELKDYSELNMEDISCVEEKSHSLAFNTSGILSAISGDAGIKTSGYRSSSTVGRPTRRRSSDAGRTDTMLEEFQNARESLRNRRQEILRQGQNARDVSPWRGSGGGRRVSRPATRKARTQVQSLDRCSNVRPESSLSKQKHFDIKDTSSESLTSSVEVFDVSTGTVIDSYTVEDTKMPSPIIEENGAITGPKRDPSKLHFEAASTKTNQFTSSPSPSERSAFLETMKVNRGHISSSSSTSSSRHVSFEHSPIMSPTSEYPPSDLFGRKSDPNSRQLRRAITSAADKKSKIEFLRENWQKRKEILIQSRGFVSSEESTSPKPDTSSVSALISENSSPAENGTTKFENSVHTEIPLLSRGIGSPPLRSKFTSVRKTQIQQQHQGSQEYAKVQPTSSPGSPRVVQKSEIPASLLDKELKKIEVTQGSNTPYTTRKLVGESVSVGARNSVTKNGIEKDEGVVDDDEEEVTVVETETITIPYRSELLQDVKPAPRAEVDISSKIEPAEANRKTADLKKSGKCEDEEVEVTFFEDTITVSLPSNSQTTMTSSNTPASTRPETHVSRTSAEGATPSTITSKSQSSSLASTSQISRASSSSYITSTTTSFTAPTSIMDGRDTTDAKRTILDKTPTFLQHTITGSDAIAKTTKLIHTSSTAETNSTTPSNITTTTAAAAAVAATTSTKTTPPSASPTTTTTSNSLYSRRYVPRTETIDVAALFTNFYKPPPSISKSNDDNKSKAAEDNKENVGSSEVKNSSNKQSTVGITNTNQSYTNARAYQAQTTPGSLVKDVKGEETTGNANKTDDTSNTTIKPRYSTISQKNYYTSAERPSPEKSSNAAEKATEPVERANPVHDTNISRGSQQAKSNQEMEEKVQTPKTYTRTVANSLYSKYYSNPNALYSKPPAATAAATAAASPTPSKHQEDNSNQISHNQKADETFSQAEATRRFYDPATSPSSTTQSRRHTVDISKTIPTGVKISDFYNKPETDESKESRVPEPKSSTTIEESPAESEIETTHSTIAQKKPQHPSSSYYSEHAVRFTQAETPIRQQLLPDKLDFKSTKTETKQKQQQQQQQQFSKVSGHQVISSPMPRLSTGSSPGSSPIIEDKEFFSETGQFDDASGSMTSSSSSRSLKEIARKKRERWRRLTVY